MICPRCKGTGLEPHPKTQSRRGTGIWGHDESEPCTECNGSGEEPVLTKSGRILTDADIQALVDEAEQGYDVDKILSRRIK